MDQASLKKLKDQFGDKLDIDKLVAQDEQFWSNNIIGNSLHVTPESVRGKNVVDVGAFFGHFALVCSAMGAKHVLAIEPDPGKFSRLKSNVAGFNNITPVNGFVSKGTFEPTPYCNNNVSPDRRSLADWASFFSSDNDMVLRLDIEGSEYDVLYGAGNGLLRFGTIFMDTHPISDEGHKAPARTSVFLQQYLSCLGFDGEITGKFFWAEWRHGKLIPVNIENWESLKFTRRLRTVQDKPAERPIEPAPEKVPASPKSLTVEAFSLSWNEEKMLPYYLRHYSKFCRQITIHDNYSTDKSLQIMKDNNVKVVPYETGNKMRDDKLIEVKNSCWKGSTADWVVVGDIDELLFSENLLSDLMDAKERGFTVIETEFFDMITDAFPTTEGNIYDVVKEGKHVIEYRKALAFRPDCIREMNYGIGGHTCQPSGQVKILNLSPIITLHCRYMSLDYVIGRYKAYNERQSQENKAHGWSMQYQSGMDDIIAKFNHIWENRIRIVPN